MLKSMFLRGTQGIIIAMILQGIVGCVTTRSTEELWSYGNFCGAGWPEVFGQTRASRVAELESTSALDDIDQLCKEHDICYEEHGMHNSVCDKNLRRHLLAIKFDSRHKRSCLKVRDQILYAFSCFQTTGYKPTNLLTGLFTIPVGLAICAVSTPIASIGSLSPTPTQGTCTAANDFREDKRRIEQCYKRAGADLKQLRKCADHK